MDGLKTKEDRRFQTFWVIFFILISVIAIIPVLRVISISFSGRDAINKGQVFIFPIGFNVDAYAKALKSGTFVSSFGYSIILMAVVTAVDMIMTILLAYPLSRKGLKGSKIVNLFCVITMYLNLGTIPNYLNIKSFGMIDTVWALIIPGALSVYNMIIMRTAFASIDDSLYEAARIDGCGEFKIMYRIAIPLCVPTIATLCLFYAVGRWNGIDDQLYYVQKTGLHTVQMALKQMIEAVNVQSEESGTTQLVAENIKAGMSTEEINTLVHEKTLSMGGYPAPLNYQGFPKSVCVSVNDQVCHGFPSEDVILKSGDIVNVDCSTILNGYFSDSSRMFCIGEVSPEKKRLVQVTRECVKKGLEQVKPWGFLGDMGQAVHDHAAANGYTVVREIGGHGVGLEFHEEPWVGYHSKRGEEMLLVPGMIFTIEPMVNMGKEDIITDSQNGWEVYTKDHMPSAQWEIMVLVTEEGNEVLCW